MKFNKNESTIVGILNVTPDSFSDGGEYNDLDDAVARSKEMLNFGADIIDIGGESTSPGSDSVSVNEELNRVLPVVKRLKSQLNSITISVDTRKAKVAEQCLQKGVEIINDVSGLRNSDMREVIAEYNATTVIMHMQGTPENMQDNPTYDDAVLDIKQYLENQINKAKNTGIEDIIIDPGIGFGKTLEHNLKILRNLEEFKQLDYPLMIGTSRKSFIKMITGAEVDNRLAGTIASNVIARINGADLFRVHDVKECKQAMEVSEAIINS